MFPKPFRIISAFNAGFLILFTLLVFFVALMPTINKFGLYQPAIIIFSLASVLTATLMLIMSARPTNRFSRLYPFAVILAFLLAFAIQILIARALTSTGYTWDAEQIYKQAAHYATSGSINPDFYSYLRSNPNNIALISGLSGYLRLMHHFGVHNLLVAAVALNVCVLFLAQTITFIVAYMLYGKRIAAISFLFVFVFISLSLYVQTPYTDTLTIVFPISIFFLALQFVKAQNLIIKGLLCSAVGALTTVGYLLKPTVIIALIAILIAAVLLAISKRNKFSLKKTLVIPCYYLACMAICAGLILFAFGKAVDASHILPYKYAVANKDAKPPLHFVAMGMRSIIVGNSVAYGGYNPGLSDTITKLRTPEAKNNFAKDAIREQLAAYGPLGYLEFLGHKAKWMMSDATFFAYGEGDNAHISFVYHDGLSNKIRQYMYVNGRYYQTFGNLLQIFWVSILLLIAMQLFFVAMSKSARFNVYTTTLRLMVTGILTFLLFFEGRSRYILLYVPIFIILALYTLRWFKEPEHEVKTSLANPS